VVLVYGNLLRKLIPAHSCLGTGKLLCVGARRPTFLTRERESDLRATNCFEGFKSCIVFLSFFLFCFDKIKTKKKQLCGEVVLDEKRNNEFE